MLKREVAKRIFAKEFEACRELEIPSSSGVLEIISQKDSIDGSIDGSIKGSRKGSINNSSIKGFRKDSMNPNLFISPLGLILNRIFLVGVLTELDNVGAQNELWKARIVDPTGAFTVYAGQYQPEASIFFSTVEVPAFVALTGKIRVYKPEPGSAFVSVRAEEANVADEELRNRWVLDTAEQTIERFEAFSVALSGGCRGEELQKYLVDQGIFPELAEGISTALEGDSDPEKFAKMLRTCILEGLQTLELGIETPAGVKGDQKELVMELLREMNASKGVDYAAFVDTAVSKGLKEEVVEEVVRSLLSSGQCYEPKIGIIRLVS